MKTCLPVLVALSGCAGAATGNLEPMHEVHPSLGAAQLQIVERATITQSRCTRLTVERQRRDGTGVNTGTTTVTLAGHAFFADPACTAAITEIVIVGPESSASYYLSHETPESFTVTASAPGLVSATLTIEALQTLESFIASLSFPGPGSGGFLSPAAEDQSAFGVLVAALMDGTDVGHEAVLDALDYELVFLTDDDIGTPAVAALRETGSSGAGTYLFHRMPDRDVIIEAPHPVFDSNTLEESVHLFQALRGRALLIAGTHRCASTVPTACGGTTSVCGGSPAPYPISDVAHNTETYFHEAHRAAQDAAPTAIAFSIHGMAATNPVASISNGTSTNLMSARSNDLADDLAARVSGPVDSCNDSADGNVLCGTTSVQGRDTNGSADPCTEPAATANGQFIHLEQSPDLRSGFERWDDVAAAIDGVTP